MVSDDMKNAAGRLCCLPGNGISRIPWIGFSCLCHKRWSYSFFDTNEGAHYRRVDTLAGADNSGLIVWKCKG